MAEHASTLAGGQPAAARPGAPNVSAAAASLPASASHPVAGLGARAAGPNASAASGPNAPAATGATATGLNTPTAAGAPSGSRLSGEGLLAAVCAFIIWGALPLYLKPLHELDSLQIISHRIAWACVLVFIWLGVRGDLGELRGVFTNRAVMGRLTVTAVLITANWLGYVWGVGHGRVVETSLGYFMNPLVNVLLGVIVLRERLNVAQWTAVGIAASAVIYITVVTGTAPWIALTLATTFSLYGLIRKVVHVEALRGLAVETLVLMPLATGYLIWCEVTGVGAFGHSSTLINALFVGCGPMTAVPLFLFAFGARLIPYSTIGLLMYIAPSLQLLCGIYLYHEPFAGARAFGFALIWLALVIYAGDGVWRARRAVGTTARA